ncbi:MAG: hypothetical protein JWR50_2353 [Mucilaginibacter sp.]|nr:hypothetical protein [Mucilaginibacter sp.]
MDKNDDKLVKEVKTNASVLSLSFPINHKGGLLEKIKRKVNNLIVNKIEGTVFQFKVYKSYWHYHFFNQSIEDFKPDTDKHHYLCLKPNYGAGIGHQLANWNAGLYFGEYYKLKFAHFPFSTDRWESFLGFGEGEVCASDLIIDKTYKKVNLPRFNSNSQPEIDFIEEIIASYSRSKVLFILELDQSYMRQFDTYKILSDKFFETNSRKSDKLIYGPGDFNIAIHIRRGDIVEMKQNGIANGNQRWLDNKYYVDVLRTVLDTLKTERNIKVFLFSQGELDDFKEFSQFNNIIYCLDMGAVESFLHMVKADLLISSKSSFSYKPALISRGIKICPESFWHQYPSTADYILADDNGEFDVSKLTTAINNYTNNDVKSI